MRIYEIYFISLQSGEFSLIKGMYPLLKWAGGKRRLAEAIVNHFVKDYNKYYEPFIGGAAILLYLAPKHAVCSDINEELINFYNVVQNDVEELISEVNDKYIAKHSKEFFYQVRAYDRDTHFFSSMNPVQRAARLIYLNKSCFNGLWRENSHGCNNVPWGYHDKVTLWDLNNLMEVHDYLSKNQVEFVKADYREIALKAIKGDLVYFDPPYDNEKNEGFVSYNAQGFTRGNQRELRELCDNLVDRGVHVVVSNADTTFMEELFTDERYTLFTDINAHRSIGSLAQYRKRVNELLVVSNNKYGKIIDPSK